MKLNRWLVPAIAAVICITPACGTTYSWSYEHPKVKSGEFAIHSACMMAAEGKVSKLGVKGQEGMSKQSDEWSTNLQSLVEAHLKSAGVTLIPAMTTDAGGASDDELKQIVLQIEQKYDDVSSKLNKKPKDIAKSRFTIGDQVALLPCAAKSDVLVFVAGEGQVTTGGKKAMGMLFGGASASGATLILTMADAKSGEIIAFAQLESVSGFGKEFMDDTEKAYGKALDKQLTKLNIRQIAPKKDQ